jgi:hypothetical protein
MLLEINCALDRWVYRFYQSGVDKPGVKKQLETKAIITNEQGT